MLTAFLLSGLIGCALNGVAQPVRAAEPATTDDAYSALAAFVGSIKVAEPKLVRADTVDLRDDAYSALATFVQSIAVAQPKLVRAETADLRDDADSALADFVQRINGGERTLIAATKKSTTDPWDLTKSTQPKSKNTAKPNRATDDAIYVGTKVCLGCQSSQAGAFNHRMMGRIGKTQKGKFECENCHGPGSLHVKAGGGRNVGGIISFRPEDTTRTAAENNAVCLACHERGDRTYWSGSTHESRGLACTNCHTVMKNVSRKSQLKHAFEPDTCFQCHKDRRAQMFRSSHMPLREGKITCSNCHNPHGSPTEALLREASINDNCYKCHAEKRGPFLFEHAPVRENCANCHEPHGSINEFMLKVARPRLCAECHSFDHGPGITSGPAARYTFSRSCQNCHTKVHGTNHPSGALLHR